MSGGLCRDELAVGFFALLCCRDINKAREKGSVCHQLAQLLIRKENPVSRQLNNLLDFISEEGPPPGLDSSLVEGLEGLGLEDIRAQAGGRHNNDHADFRKIQIMPTIEELMSTEEPYLPNFIETERAVLDRQFRLLRSII